MFLALHSFALGIQITFLFIGITDKIPRLALCGAFFTIMETLWVAYYLDIL